MRRHNGAVPRYDVIVVGAGPAGSTCAYHLASAGASVLLLDRARFPRDKPCGGGVTGRAARLLPFSISPVVEDTVTSVRMRLGFGSWFERGDGEPLVLMTQRIRLDAFLAERAAEAGAEFRDDLKVTSVAAGPDGVEVVAGSERLLAETVIGADGINGISARALELGGNQAVGVALEGNVPYDRLGEATADGPCSSSASCPAATGGSFPRATTRTSGSGAGSERDRACAKICARSAPRTA